MEPLLTELSPTAKRLADKILLGDALWLPHPSNKPQILAYTTEADILYYGGAAGGGKALASNEPVITPWGYKAIGDLVAGDTIMNPDGTAQKVLYVYHQGVQDLFEVGFQDGVSVKCTADHLWMYEWSKSSRHFIEPKALAEYPFLLSTEVYNGRKWRIASTEDLYRQFNCKKLFSPKIPLSLPLDLVDPAIVKPYWEVLDPYVLGVLLGDGGFSSYDVKFSTADELILEEVVKRTGSEWVKATNGYDWYSRGQVKLKLRESLKKLGLLGLTSESKFIPKEYLLSPSWVRWELLQGLMDTDGTATVGGECRFNTTSSKLAKGVVTFVRSLGGRATINTRTGNEYFNNSYVEFRPCKNSYSVSIQIKEKSNLFKLPRKVDRVGKDFYGEESTVKRRIDYIEPAGQGEATCIAVDHPNGLFLTRGFVVTHNSDLLLGLAITDHQKSILFRREYKQLAELVDRSTEILQDTAARYSQTAAKWVNIPGDRVLEFGAVQHEKDKENYKGRPHDLVCFDEIGDFSETQFRFLMGWNRTTDPEQRCRVVCTGNPPTRPEGRWVLGYWAPWLRKDHSNPAKPGELRWFAVLDGRDTEVPSGEEFNHKGELIKPLSRTFIPAFLKDNPYLWNTQYYATLQGLPEPLRSQLLKGVFTLDPESQDNQVIPVEWVRAAQARWKEDDIRANSSFTAVGVDPSRGGKDPTAVAPRTGTYFHPIELFEGELVKTGQQAVTHITSALGSDFAGVILVDVIGIGSSIYDLLTDLDFEVVDVNASTKSYETDRSGKLTFRNLRAEAYWKLREALEPDLGDNLALPPDEELVDELTAPTWELTSNGILIESKSKIKQRLGRSPNKADAVVLSYMDLTSGVLFR